MKTLASDISILKNTNRAVSTSEDDWSLVKEGDLLRIGGDSIFYQIGKINPLFYIKDFVVNNPRELIINDNVGINLLADDTLTISYKEYELSDIVKANNEGQGYQDVDVIFVKDECIYSTNLTTNEIEKASIQIKEVDGSGAIKNYSILTKGKFLKCPPVNTSFYGGMGENAEFQCEYKLTDNRVLIERIIEKVEVSDKTKIYLNYPLPDGIIEGKISVNKHELFITSPYLGEDQIEVSYQVINNFTPNLRIPIPVKNSLSADVVYKTAVLILDQEIQSLKNRVKILEG